MEKNDNKNHFLKTDQNVVINEASIKWVVKMNECLHVCVKANGCNSIANFDTHTICKKTSENSYNKLSRHFD